MKTYNSLKNFVVKIIIIPIRKLGLKTKWMIFIFIFVVSLSFALVSFFIKSGKKDLETDLKAWGISLINNLAFSAQEAVLDTNYEKLNYYLKGIMNHRDMLYSAIFDKDGSLIAFQNTEYLFNLNLIETGLSKNSLQITEHQTRNGDYFYNFVTPIRIVTVSKSQDSSRIHFDPMENAISEIKSNDAKSPDRIIGTIFIGISLANMHAKLDKMRDRAIYIAFVVAFVFIVLVYLSVDQMITAPIKNLDKATHKIAQGDLSHFVKSDRLDELGRLADSFNEMVVQLNESQEKIKHYTRTLEQQVEERTSELKISEQKYRALFDHAGMAVALIAENEKIIMVNKSFEILSEYMKLELEGIKYLADFLASEDIQEIKSIHDAVKKNKEVIFPFNHECIFIDRLENRKNINLTLNRIPGTGKLLASIVNVTELKELQKKLTRTEHLAVIGELSASIAHEIRNPLVAINTSVGILKSDLSLSGEDEELMNIISEESMRLNKIVDDFLKFARPNEPQFIETNINGLIHDTLVLLKSRLNGIQTKIELADHLPLSYADPDQLKQVLVNLVINAIEATPDGGTISISTDSVQSKNGYNALKIIVKDTGRGIREYDLKKIFQPFYSTKEDGVGMGLAICERIVQNHNGEIKVESKKGAGTQFSILLNLKAKGHSNGVYSVS
jgi:PAS domain S-box-containing protein